MRHHCNSCYCNGSCYLFVRLLENLFYVEKISGCVYRKMITIFQFNADHVLDPLIFITANYEI